MAFTLIVLFSPSFARAAEDSHSHGADCAKRFSEAPSKLALYAAALSPGGPVIRGAVTSSRDTFEGITQAFQAEIRAGTYGDTRLEVRPLAVTPSAQDRKWREELNEAQSRGQARWILYSPDESSPGPSQVAVIWYASGFLLSPTVAQWESAVIVSEDLFNTPLPEDVEHLPPHLKLLGLLQFGPERVTVPRILRAALTYRKSNGNSNGAATAALILEAVHYCLMQIKKGEIYPHGEGSWNHWIYQALKTTHGQPKLYGNVVSLVVDEALPVLPNDFESGARLKPRIALTGQLVAALATENPRGLFGRHDVIWKYLSLMELLGVSSHTKIAILGSLLDWAIDSSPQGVRIARFLLIYLNDHPELPEPYRAQCIDQAKEIILKPNQS